MKTIAKLLKKLGVSVETPLLENGGDNSSIYSYAIVNETSSILHLSFF
jgi:hypothetical protein